MPSWLKCTCGLPSPRYQRIAPGPSPYPDLHAAMSCDLANEFNQEKMIYWQYYSFHALHNPVAGPCAATGREAPPGPSGGWLRRCGAARDCSRGNGRGQLAGTAVATAARIICTCCGVRSRRARWPKRPG